MSTHTFKVVHLPTVQRYTRITWIVDRTLSKAQRVKTSELSPHPTAQSRWMGNALDRCWFCWMSGRATGNRHTDCALPKEPPDTPIVYVPHIWDLYMTAQEVSYVHLKHIQPRWSLSAGVVGLETLEILNICTMRYAGKTTTKVSTCARYMLH